MKAGRELDALIAEKVMGWKRGHYNDAQWLDGNETSRGWVALFSPSTDIAYAWQVVEKFEIYTIGTTTLGNMAVVMPFATFWSDIYEITEVGETPAHAICLAALKIKTLVNPDHP